MRISMAVTSRFEISKKTHQASYHMHSAHAHSYYEMFYLISGGCDLFIKNNVYNLPTGNITFIPAAAPHFLLRCCPAWMCIDWIYTELFKRAGYRIRHSMAAKPPVFQNLLSAGGLPQWYQCHAESDSCRTPVVWYFFKLHVKNVFSDLGRAYFTVY